MAESKILFAYHLDLKRAMPTTEYVKRIVGQLAGWGFNAIVMELENKFRFRNHPMISHPSAPTETELQEMLEAMRAKGIEVIPLIQTLGHAEYVLTKPGYEQFRVAPDVEAVYDPMSDKAKALIKDLIDDAIDRLKPKRFFHVGGDETHGLEKSEAGKAIIEKEGVGGLYLRHMLPILEHVRSRGLRPMIWCDILLAHPEVVERVPRDTVICDWDYWTGGFRTHQTHVWGQGRLDWAAIQKLSGPTRDLLDRFAVDNHTRQDGTLRGFFYFDVLADRGFEVMTCSAARCYGDNVGVADHGVHMPNAFHSARKAATSERGIGNLVTSWAVRHDHPETTWPAVFAAAAALRQEQPFDREKLIRAFTKDFFGRELPELSEAAKLAAEKVPFSESWSILNAKATLTKGGDPIAELKAQLEGQPSGLKAELDRIGLCRKGFDRCRTMLSLAKRRAAANADSLDFWVEGAELMSFYADFATAALRDTLAAQGADLQKRLRELRGHTAELFGRTYHPSSVVEELDLRYGLHEALLQRASTTS